MAHGLGALGWRGRVVEEGVAEVWRDMKLIGEALCNGVTDDVVCCDVVWLKVCLLAGRSSRIVLPLRTCRPCGRRRCRAILCAVVRTIVGFLEVANLEKVVLVWSVFRLRAVRFGRGIGGGALRRRSTSSIGRVRKY